jgi:hypothetical protein
MLDRLAEGLGGVEGGWWLLGAAAVVGVAKGARPLAKGAIKGYLAARDGVMRATSASREGLRHLYEEAEAEYRGVTSSTGPAEPAAEEASMPRPMAGGGVLLTPTTETA